MAAKSKICTLIVVLSLLLPLRVFGDVVNVGCLYVEKTFWYLIFLDYRTPFEVEASNVKLLESGVAKDLYIVANNDYKHIQKVCYEGYFPIPVVNNVPAEKARFSYVVPDTIKSVKRVKIIIRADTAIRLSDLWLKLNFHQITNGLEVLRALYGFQYKAASYVPYGILVLESDTLISVFDKNKGYVSNYNWLPFMINAVSVLKEKVDQLDADITHKYY